MRSDYALYTVAIIFFIIMGAVFALEMAEFERNLWVVTTVILGLLFIGLGYSQRPKLKPATIETLPTPAAPTTVAEEKTEIVMEVVPTTAMALTKVKGIGERRAEQLKALSINSVEYLAKASAKDLAVKLQVSPKITRRWIRNAKKLVEKS
jgi:predicted flap endonuclease-1-like 5' DNA nuclease